MSPASSETTCSRTRTPTKPHLRPRLLPILSFLPLTPIPPSSAPPQLLDPVVLFPSRCLQLRHDLVLPRDSAPVTPPLATSGPTEPPPPAEDRLLPRLILPATQLYAAAGSLHASPLCFLLAEGDLSSAYSPRAATSDGRRIVRLFSSSGNGRWE
jgi:hypothetical protein